MAFLNGIQSVMRRQLMKIGDLSYDPSLEMNGVVIGWLITGGHESTFWEILYEDGEIDGTFESDVEVVSESR